MKPMGLSQADYEELENPSRAAEPRFASPSLTWWEKSLCLLAFALALVLTTLLYVYAQLCRIGNRK